MSKLKKDYYLQDNVIAIAKDLLGKVLVTKINNQYTSGIICETEAYAGITDKASHAYGGRRTERTETMYAEGGTSYVYLCYGIHYLFNVVTNVKDIPHAVLIRGIKPLDGIEIIKQRRATKTFNNNTCIGPGKMSHALGITKKQNTISLLSNTIWIEDNNSIHSKLINTGTRIGIDYAEEDALLPYRFWINDLSKI